MVDSSAPPPSADASASALRVFAITESVPAWAVRIDAPCELALGAHAVEPSDRGVTPRSVTLVDAALLDGDLSFVRRIEAALGPVVAVCSASDSATRAKSLGAVGAVPASLLNAPRSAAMSVLNDVLQDQPLSVDGLERYMRDAIHEFRTPLTVISEFVGLCEDGVGGPLTDRQRTYMGYIQSAVDRMGEQFDDYRDGLRIQLGSLEHRVGTDSIESVLESALVTMGVLEGDHAARVDLTAAGSMKLDCIDGPRLGEALKRILANAKKLSGPKECLDISAVDQESTVAIRVAYTGTELSDEDVDVMERGVMMRADGFYRSVARVFGLGVSMARMFLIQSGGSLHLEHRPGSGAVFVVTVPARRAGAKRLMAA